MVPSAYVHLDILSVTPNGKLDRRALPASASERTVEDTYIAPKQEVHYQLVRFWEELLDVRPIGIRDNFFELGGHSLLTVRLVDRMEQVWDRSRYRDRNTFINRYVSDEEVTQLFAGQMLS
jgi:hypothetical protein